MDPVSDQLSLIKNQNSGFSNTERALLRPYQIDAINSLWNEILVNDTALLVLPTGAGKSLIMRELSAKAISAKPDIKICVLFNKVKLLRDQAKAFKNAGVYCATENSYDLTKTITVASVKSLPPEKQKFDLIITDEAHNIDDKSGVYFIFFETQRRLNPKVKIIGVTATPWRYDGPIYGSERLFKSVCYQKPMRYFIDKGYLVAPVAKQPDFQIDISKLRILKGEYRQDDIDAQTMNEEMAKDQIKDALNRSHGRNKIVWFCSSINHAELINKILNQMGEKSVTVHSNMSWDDRDTAHRIFEQEDGRHLTFVSVISEGFDYPPIDCIVLMRPTRSLTVFMQTVGRGLRTFKNKTNCLVLDYGNVVSSLGPIENPNIPVKGKGSSKIEPRLKSCPECRTYVQPRTMTCQECGFTWPKQEATKLLMQADEDASFFEKKIHKMEIDNVQLSIHLSKNQNRCIKITYYSKKYFEEPINEYFAVDTTFGSRRFMARALEMEIQMKENIDDQVKEYPKKLPKTLEHFLEGRYQRVKRLVFE